MKNRVGNCQHGLSLDLRNPDCCLVCSSPKIGLTKENEDMKLMTAFNLTCTALADDQLRIAVQALTDRDLRATSTAFITSLLGIHAGTYRDLELVLDLTGNLDAPL